MAELSQDYEVFQDQVIKFDRVIENINASYSPDLGIFACEDDDFYLFSWAIQVRDFEAYTRLMMGDSELFRGGLTRGEALGGESGTTLSTAIVKCEFGVGIKVHAWDGRNNPEINLKYVTPFTSLVVFKIAKAADQKSTLEVENPAFFSARLQVSTEYSDRQVIGFNQTVTNEGGFYSPLTGLFVCREEGTFVFFWSLRTYGSGERGMAQLVRGGQDYKLGPLTYLYR